MKVLQVLPNPYGVLDADGKPTAVVPCHSRHAPGEYVGAIRTMIETEPAQYADVKKVVNGKTVVEQKLAQLDRSKASFTFSTEPVQVPADGIVGVYYRDRVREGTLIAADVLTAQKCGVQFEAPEKAIARERDKAAKEFQRQFGDKPEWAQPTNQAPSAAPK
jgi:hypothetical protein